MIRKLKIKFIVISSLSMLVVLLIVLGIVNGFSYYNTRLEIFSVMSGISKNNGFLPEKVEYRTLFGSAILTDESKYGLRFFAAVTDDEGLTLNLENEQVATISDADKMSYLSIAVRKNRKEGFFTVGHSTYAFQRTELDETLNLYVIMDCTRQLHAMQVFALASIYIGLASMILLLLILSAFAKKAVAPVVNNIESQKMFITNASHELKTPLAIISANTEVLEMTEGKNEWTESTMEQVQRMTELISHLITLSRLQEKDEITLTDVNISEVTEKVASEFRVLAEKNGLCYETAITPGRTVKADEAGLRELISILIDNAVKYCTEGGTIRVTLEPKIHGTVLAVSNTFPEKEGVDYSRFFDRFYRADTSHSSEKKGFGIGLSMAKHFTEMFKGKISVSYKNGMITFTVAF